MWASESCSIVSDSSQPHGLYSPLNSPGQNTGVGSLCLLQGIFPTQGLNPGLPHCRWILYHLSHKGSPIFSGSILLMVVYNLIYWQVLYYLKVKVLVIQMYLTLLDPIDCSPSGSSVHGILQARILEWVKLPFPSPGDLPDPGIEARSPTLQADTLPSEPPGNAAFKK